MSTGYLIIFFRLFGIPLLFLGYLLYQVLVKKKRWPVLKNDVFVSLFFTVVYVGLYLVLT